MIKLDFLFESIVLFGCECFGDLQQIFDELVVSLTQILATTVLKLLKVGEELME